MHEAERFGSVWDAIERPEDAAKLKACADLMVQIARIIEENSWSVSEAAERFRSTPAAVEDILNGLIDRVRIDDLLAMTGALGRKVRVEIEAA